MARLIGADPADVALIASVSAAAGFVASQFGPAARGQNVGDGTPVQRGVTVTVSGGGGGGSSGGGGGGGGGVGGVVVVISSWTGGPGVVVLVEGVARLVFSVRVTSTATDATSATAATMATTPTTHGQRGGSESTTSAGRSRRSASTTGR